LPLDKIMSKPDHISQYHDYGIYIPTRTIDIKEDITPELEAQVSRNLHILDNTKGTIHIKINTEGGCTISARAIYDSILNCKNFVKIIGTGEITSSGSLIMQAADERWMTQNSHMMIHIGQTKAPADHPRNKERWDAFDKEILELWVEDVYLRRIKEKKKRFTRSQIKSLIQFDKYLLPKEAIELGLCDLIGDPLGVSG
jgi:ATP-dependent protease ClpP protease subunit